MSKLKTFIPLAEVKRRLAESFAAENWVNAEDVEITISPMGYYAHWIKPEIPKLDTPKTEREI